MDFVLDNSVSMRWLQPGEKKKEQKYAYSVLESLVDNSAITSDVWRIEAVNAVVNLIKFDNITQNNGETYLSFLNDMNIFASGESVENAFNSTFMLAQKHKLASYDSSYLELAIREDLPLATLDKAMIRAAKKEDVSLWLR